MGIEIELQKKWEPLLIVFAERNLKSKVMERKKVDKVTKLYLAEKRAGSFAHKMSIWTVLRGLYRVQFSQKI